MDGAQTSARPSPCQVLLSTPQYKAKAKTCRFCSGATSEFRHHNHPTGSPPNHWVAAHCPPRSRKSAGARQRATFMVSRSVRPTFMAWFSQRAIWLRLPPMRPMASTSAGSTRGTGLRRRASERPSASRRSVEAGKPAASALARNSAFSAAVQRKTKVSVSRSVARALPAPVGVRRGGLPPLARSRVSSASV